MVAMALCPNYPGSLERGAAGSVLYLALIALLRLGVAAAIRDPAAAIGVVLGLLYLFPIVASVVAGPHWYRHLQQADDGGARHPGHHHPPQPAHQPVGGSRRARRMGPPRRSWPAGCCCGCATREGSLSAARRQPYSQIEGAYSQMEGPYSQMEGAPKIRRIVRHLLSLGTSAPPLRLYCPRLHPTGSPACGSGRSLLDGERRRRR